MKQHLINEGKKTFLICPRVPHSIYCPRNLLHVNCLGKASGIFALAQSSSCYMMYVLSKGHKSTGCKINNHNSIPVEKFVICFYRCDTKSLIYDSITTNNKEKERRSARVHGSCNHLYAFISYVRSASLCL